MDSFPEQHRRLQQLAQKLGVAAPGVMGAFAKLHTESIAAGELSAKHKELIALAIGIAARCDGCVAYHVHDALRAGASRQEIVETIGVAIMMGGGPALVYGCDALEALDQFA